VGTRLGRRVPGWCRRSPYGASCVSTPGLVNSLRLTVRRETSP
jgi:hypothetical protein